MGQGSWSGSGSLVSRDSRRVWRKAHRSVAARPCLSSQLLIDSLHAGGFGYGIEDADEDDDDIYRSGPSKSIADGPGRFAFHQDDDDDEEMLRMGPSRPKGAALKVRTHFSLERGLFS